jgi:phage FluMu protein Com
MPSKEILKIYESSPKCPRCGQPILCLKYTESVKQVWVQGKWVDNDERDIRIKCSECDKVLLSSDLEKIGYQVHE